MRYVSYLIKCVIRRLVYIFIKPKYILIFLVSLVVIYFLSSQGVFAATTIPGNYTYQDTVNTIHSYYESTLDDILNRLSGMTETQYNNLRNRINSGKYGVWAFYTASNTSANVSGVMRWDNSLNTQFVTLILYELDNVSSSANLDDPAYFNQFTQSRIYTLTGYIYSFNGSKVTLSDFENGRFAIPASLFGYVYHNFYSYFRDNSQENADNIVSAIEEQTNSINDSIQSSTDEINNSLTSTDYDENTVNIDTSSTDDVSDSETTGLFTTIFNNFSDLLDSSSWDEVEVIEIGLPYVDNKIQIRSDILSSLVSSGLLGNLITIAWYSVFGLYVFKFVNNLIHSIKSGDILGGLSLNNEVITNTML